ncbi:Deoxyadenosine/deoxycytidine kinase [Nitrosospira sp. Nl5]|uniref:deoxynucleoside kinase n=1 Tax=Nitrosospira sp. Nl5 TaxID=200120 RepID=UPI000881649D|nr:deoxynucleoside kinase [Nitrosospira sp. Nl5]SCY61062.1 Deoxyadenosine/deoxycytidine kinase [Nitrosospira sp. Nl5]
MTLEKYRYIVVEGPIGAGKTSLAQRMASCLSGTLLLEKPAENPFLEKFYGDMPRYALPTQLFFLFQRANQLQGFAQMDMFTKVTVSDFLLEKDNLFARLTLSDAEYDLYQQIYRHLKPQAATPDLVIYLQASPATLMERVKRRGSAFEKTISEEYLWRLSDSYTSFFHQYEDAPVMMINSENLNFVDSQEDFDLLLQQVEQMRGPREYFNRGS